MTSNSKEPEPNDTADDLARLEAMLSSAANQSRPPVHLWSPPERPDIGLEIEADGRWTHQGTAFARQDLVKLFASVLRREDDGRHFVVTPAEKVPVSVADVAFIAIELEARGAGKEQELIWRTNVEDVVVTGTDHAMRFVSAPPDDAPVPYIAIRNGLEARASRSVYYELVDQATTEPVDDVEMFGVWSGGVFFPMAAARDLSDDPAGGGSE